VKKTILFLGSLIFISIQVFSQVYTNKLVGDKNQALKDSIEKLDYPYALPIWGKKAAAKGYQLPYSAGIGVNYLWQESEIVIDDLMVGFNGGEMHSLDEVIRFDKATASANAVNIRPDLWLFPFLDIYGILAFAKTSTAIDAGIWMPDLDSAWSQVSTLSTKANFEATSLGFGMTPTFGVGGIWIALDMNFVWTDVSALDKPVFTFVFGPRVGKTFKFKNPDMNIAGWVGAFRLNYSSATSGSINLSDLFPVAEMQAKVDQGFEKVAETSTQVETWWSSLTPVEQKNPVNKSKYDAANKALAKATDVLTSADGALNDGKSATVQYSLDKTVKNKWNFIIGTQFQINRHLMLRAEYGFLGSRQQFIGGLQYRFGL
jgi:hypothetical protein